MSDEKQARDSRGKFAVQAKSKDGSATGGASALAHVVSRSPVKAASVKFEDGLTPTEYATALAEAKALKDSQDKAAEDAKVWRVEWQDDQIMTILTAAMVVNFSKVMGENVLNCSGDADALARLPEILTWLEVCIPRARNLARRMCDLACYVDWRLRGATCALLGFDPMEVDCRS